MHDYFASTAPYYKQYRPFYPDDLLGQIKVSFCLSAEDRILDIGAGTGQLAVGLAPFVGEVVAVEPDVDMIRYGKELVSERDIHSIRWMHTTAEGLIGRDDLGTFALASFGASFHWMDQRTLLEWLDGRIAPDGGIAVAGSKSVWRPLASWEEKVKEVIQKHLGDERRAGTGKFQRSAKTNASFEELISHSPFSDLHLYEYEVDQVRTTDEVVGRMYSTSFANPAVLGERKEAFERDLRETLLEYNPEGIFQKTDEYYLFTGKRP